MGIKRTVSIRRIDLWGSEPLESKKMKQKMQKTEISIFPMYFWANSFVKKNRKGRQQGVHQFENQSYLCVQYIKQFHFFTTPFLFLNFFKYHLRMTRPNGKMRDPRDPGSRKFLNNCGNFLHKSNKMVVFNTNRHLLCLK